MVTRSPTAPPTIVPANTGDEAGVQYCVRHPSRETLVSCGRCGRPFCTECLIHTPAGQRCYECAGMRRDFAQRAAASQVLQAGALMVAGGLISLFLGSILFVIMGAAIAGGAAGQSLSPLVNRHTRAYALPGSFLLVLLGGLLGGTLAGVVQLAMRGAPLGIPLFTVVAISVATNLSFWIFAVISCVAAYARMR